MFYFFYFFWRICLFFGALTWIQLKKEKKNFCMRRRKKRLKTWMTKPIVCPCLQRIDLSLVEYAASRLADGIVAQLRVKHARLELIFFKILFLSFISHFKYTTCMHLLDKNFIVFFYILFKKKKQTRNSFWEALMAKTRNTSVSEIKTAL